MNKNFKIFLYKFDFLGKTPQLRVFNNNSYKSTFTFFLSIILFLFSTTFIIYSLIEYFKYESPIVNYSKDNDKNTNRSLIIKETLLMFKMADNSGKTADKSPVFFESKLSINYFNGTLFENPLTIENCKLGDNIDLKFKDIINEVEKIGESINNFFCISSKHGDISLFYNPEIGYSSIYLYPIISENTNYTPEELQSLIISENDILDSNNKLNPITYGHNFQVTSNFNSVEFTRINYNFQYIKYESDNGIFFKKNKIFDAKTFSDITSYLLLVFI